MLVACYSPTTAAAHDDDDADTGAGAWNSSNFLELLQYSQAHNISVYAWEFCVLSAQSLVAIDYRSERARYVYLNVWGHRDSAAARTFALIFCSRLLIIIIRAEDVTVLRTLLREGGYAASGINGPAIAYQQSYLSAFATEIAALSDVVNHVSWHHCTHVCLASVATVGNNIWSKPVDQMALLVDPDRCQSPSSLTS